MRSRLREATGAKEVSSAAIEALVVELEALFMEALARTQSRYRHEMEARHVHGLYPRPIIRPDHVVPIGHELLGPVTVKSLREVGPVGLVKRAIQEVTNEEDAPEVA